MVRVFQVEPEILDDRRLLGQHNELHILINLHMRRLRIAAEQNVRPENIDWTGIKMGWRTHPQFTWWFGKVGALMQFHNIVRNEIAIRKWKKYSPEKDFYEFVRENPHPSPIDEQLEELPFLDIRDKSYGSFVRIAVENPDRVIRDLRHLFEKWDRDVAVGRPPTRHDPIKAENTLAELLGSFEAFEEARAEKLLT